MIVIPYQFDPRTVDLILEGLGKLPYERVHETYQKIHEHALKTVEDAHKTQEDALRAELSASKRKSRKAAA
jgi:hypothetical protein